MSHPKYVKGFKFDREKIALVAEVQSSHDPEVDAYFPIIKNMLNPHGYMCFTLVWENDVPRDAPDGRLAVVVVLDTGDDAEELRQRKLGELDSSIEAARVALAGPDVWERY